jgi:hypothetical protein
MLENEYQRYARFVLLNHHRYQVAVKEYFIHFCKTGSIRFVKTAICSEHRLEKYARFGV